MLSTLNKVKYSGLDFFTHFDDLRSRLQAKFGKNFNDFALSQLGVMLVDLVSFAADTLSFFVDRRASDLYLKTARTRRSVSMLARQVGYKMGAAISSSVDLNVSILNPQSFSAPIPKGFQFVGPNELIFESAQIVTFAPNDGPTVVRTVPCYEGQTFVETFVSDGSPNQRFELRKVPDASFVVSGTVVVLVNGAQFSEVEFITVNKTDQFEVGYNDEPATVNFGDDTAGNIPASGSTIQVTYVASRGISGQVAKGTINDVVSPLVVNFTTIRLSIDNPRSSVGGDDPESLEHTKAAAGRVFKSRQVAVTRGDFETLAGKFADPLFGRVAVAQAISTRAASSDLTLQNLVLIIQSAVAPVKPAVDAQFVIGAEAVDQINADVSSLSTDLSSIAIAASNIVSEADTTISSARTSKNKAEEIGTDAQDIQGMVIDGKAAIDAVPTALTSQLTTVDKDNLKSFLDRINSQALSVFSTSEDIGTAASSEISSLGTIKDLTRSVGTTISESSSFLLSLDTVRQDLSVQAFQISTALAAIAVVVVDETFTVDQALAAIQDHVDAILAADCQANLVTVPILARDSAGFYAAPTTSLISSLQTYLDARKEVTQTVAVTSGANFLIRAIVSIGFGIRSGVSAQVAKTSLSAAMDSVLRNRLFGGSLHLSELMGAGLGVTGVVFVNVTINGHFAQDGITVLTTRLDTNGNLIVPTSEVISKGQVTISDPEVTTLSVA